MYKYFKVIITNIDCLVTPEEFGSKSPEEIDAELAAKRATWPATLEFELDCEEFLLEDELKRLASERLDVAINTLSYEILESEVVGLA